MNRKLALIVAVARNGVIGKGGALPWHISEDLKHFKKLTMGHAVIMGRKTHVSIGKALPGRRNIVVTSDASALAAECEQARSLNEALELAYQSDEMPFVIGGARLYQAALPLATHIYWTAIDHDVEGDTFFPAFDESEFEEIEREVAKEPDVSFRTLIRKSSVHSG